MLNVCVLLSGNEELYPLHYYIENPDQSVDSIANYSGGILLDINRSSPDDSSCNLLLYEPSISFGENPSILENVSI